MQINYISVELSNEAGEIAMLEESREEISCKLRRAPDDEGGPLIIPRDYVVGPRIFDKHVCFQQERWWRSSLEKILRTLQTFMFHATSLLGHDP